MPETAWIASLAVGGYLSHIKGSERGRYSHLSNVAFPLAPFMERIGAAVDDIVHDVYAERCLQLYGRRVRFPDWRPSGQPADHPMHIRRAGDEPKQRWIDGTPLNTFYVAALLKLFPQARFIHNLRRPADVATSLEGFDRVGASSRRRSSRDWRPGSRTPTTHGMPSRALGRDRAFRLDFHRIADEPDALFRELCEFLGEPFAPECLQPLKRQLNSWMSMRSGKRTWRCCRRMPSSSRRSRSTKPSGANPPLHCPNRRRCRCWSSAWRIIAGTGRSSDPTPVARRNDWLAPPY